MAVSAAIKYVQGATVGTAGVALFGVLGTSVVASNGNDANVLTWRWTMLDVPPGSAVPVGVISDGSTTNAPFSPDVRGGYHMEVLVRGNDGSTAVDRRVFQIKELSGRWIPPFKAESPALNFADYATVRGWAFPMEQWLHQVDGRAPLANAGTGNLAAVTTQTSGVDEYAIRFTGAAPNIQGLVNGRDGRVMFAYFVNNGTIANESGSAAAADRVSTPGGTTVTVSAGGMGLFLYDGSSGRWRLLVAGGASLTPAGAAGAAQQNDGAGALAATTPIAFLEGSTSVGLVLNGAQVVTASGNAINMNALDVTRAIYAAYNSTDSVINPVSTTDNTTITMASWTIVDGVTDVSGSMEWIQNTGAASGVEAHRRRIKNVAGTVTLGTDTSTFSSTEDSNVTYAIDNSTTTGRHRVTGLSVSTTRFGLQTIRRERSRAA